MKTESFSEKVLRAWYQGSPWLLPLYPLSWLVALVARRRLRQYRANPGSAPVPVVVVGNITVGGTGKTPVVVALCEFLQQRGLKVVVVSRGYGSRASQYPLHVDASTDVTQAGDEPLLIARRTGSPVLIDPDRRRALDFAMQQFSPDVIISDDGLQHYALPRDMEIVVVDGARGLGNGRCLPAGPLREPAERLDQCDWVVVNGAERAAFPGATVMMLDSADPVNLKTGASMVLEDFIVRRPFCHAVAGIGNPERFFSTLEASGLRIERHAFPDHHDFSDSDFQAFSSDTVLMTEKDAVKCQSFAGDDWWYLPVTARLPTVLFEEVLAVVKRRVS